MRRRMLVPVIAAGIVAGVVLSWPGQTWQALMKLTGRAVECPWSALLYEPIVSFNSLRHRFRVQPVTRGDGPGALCRAATPMGISGFNAAAAI